MRALLPYLLAAVLQAQNPVDEAVKLLEQNKPAEALPILKSAVVNTPDDVAAQFHLALAYSLLQQDTEAIAVYRKVLELQPGLYEAELNLGQVLLRQKDAASARPLLEAAVAQKPKERRPNYLLGEALLSLNEPAAAETSFRAAAEADPKSADAMVGVARAQIAQQHAADALASLDKAAALDPADAGIRQLAAAATAQAGLEKLTTGDSKAAIPQLEAALAKSPTPALKYALATAYLRDQQITKATAIARSAVADDPKNVEMHMFLGRLLRDQKLYAPAAREFQLVTQLKPDSADAWTEFAGMLILLQQHAAALVALDQVKALSGETPAYWYFRATILDAEKDYVPALASYRRFLEIAGGKFPDEEFKARQRARIVQKILQR